MKPIYPSIILAISIFLALTTSTSAAPGDLDPTFGNGGKVITRGNSINHLDYALAIIFHNNRFNLHADPAVMQNIIVRGFIESPEYRQRFGPQ